MSTFDDESIHLSEGERLRIACRAAGVGIWQWDLLSGRMIYSAVARQICGFPAGGEVTFEMVRDVTHPEDYPWTSAAAKRALDPELREQPTYRYRIRRADTGDVRWVTASGEARFAEIDGEPRAVLYVGTLQDVTEQKLAEEALAQSEARLRLALDAGEMVVWELDQATDQVTASPELNRLFGFPEDARVTAEEYRSRYAPGERQRVQDLGAAALSRGEDRLQTVVHLVLPDGRNRHVLLRAQAAPGSTAGTGKVIGVLMDVTGEIEREARLERNYHELRHRLQNMVALASALAARSFGRNGPQARELHDYLDRLRALSTATGLMFSGEMDDETPVRDLLEGVVAPYRQETGSPFEIAGPEIAISGRQATSLAMAVHELATNAVKHGALSDPCGRIDLSWRRSEEQGTTEVFWKETGGPAVKPPARHGFGMQLLRGGLFSAPDHIDIEFRPEGLACRICLAIPEQQRDGRSAG